MGVKGTIKKLGEVPSVIGYEAELRTMQGQYEEWLFWQEHAQAMKETVDPSNYFGNHPIRAIQYCFQINPRTMLLYGDEDCKCKDGAMGNPWFRPDWSPERLESCFYLGSLIAIRRTFLEEQLPNWKEIFGPYEIFERNEENHLIYTEPSAVFVNETPTEEYRNAVFALCEQAGGWEKGCESIAHLPGILHHNSKQEHLEAFASPNMRYHRERTIHTGLLSVIILTKDHPELLEQCIASLKKACRPAENAASGQQEVPCEIIVVDNGSTRENRERMEKLTGITYLYEPMEFNFSRLCNIGAANAKGEYYLFLNDDVELLPESRVDQMMSLAARPGVGSVGLKLYYPGGTMIQHVGITNLSTGPVHKLLFLDDKSEYYFGRNRGMFDLLAVSAACVMLRAEVFREAGQFDESLAVAYNDVALGFQLHELGYRNVICCDAYAYHHESLTRGSDAQEQKRERLMKEQERLYELFPKLKGKDPYYSEFLSRQATDTYVRPTYETAKNACQSIVPKPATVISGIRIDPCLNVAVEEERDGEIIGYAVVLGDDNACYDRYIILEKDSGERYQAKLNAQYRPDLAAKMADQVHVALSGFWIRLEPGILPAGKYRVGCLAKRKVGNLKLFYWSTKELKIK
ncbi:MAG: glycosyltransferase [Lachnospiraceae bacterium]|nr:glycosyltransferase [Lachnospiraceae bacterium]